MQLDSSINPGALELHYTGPAPPADKPKSERVRLQHLLRNPCQALVGAAFMSREQSLVTTGLACEQHVLAALRGIHATFGRAM